MVKAVDLSSDKDVVFRLELGKLYLTSGRPDEAKKQLITAVQVNPGLAESHYYLGAVFLREGDYDRARFAAKTAQSLGYKNQDLIHILSILSNEPRDVPRVKRTDKMYMRHIVVDSLEEAESVLHKITHVRPLQDLSGKDLIERGDSHDSFIGYIETSKVHPVVASALLEQKAYADPVIVNTEVGFHIIQRLMPLDIYFNK